MPWGIYLNVLCTVVPLLAIIIYTKNKHLTWFKPGNSVPEFGHYYFAWYSPGGVFTTNSQDINHKNVCEKGTFTITATPSRDIGLDNVWVSEHQFSLIIKLQTPTVNLLVLIDLINMFMYGAEIYASVKKGCHSFRSWLVAYSTPNHYLNQNWFISQLGRSPKVVALFQLQTLVAIWYDFFNCMIQSKWNQIMQESTIVIII